MQPTLDPRRLVFIDKTRASTNMTPRYGRCGIGKRLIGHTPFGHWKTTTVVAALRHDGLTAPCVFDGAMNGNKFTAYVEQELVATLHPGDIVIMDNLSSHKRAAVREAIQAAGVELRFLPPYSPCCAPRSLIQVGLESRAEIGARAPVEQRAIGVAGRDC